MVKFRWESVLWGMGMMGMGVVMLCLFILKERGGGGGGGWDKGGENREWVVNGFLVRGVVMRRVRV